MYLPNSPVAFCLLPADEPTEFIDTAERSVERVQPGNLAAFCVHVESIYILSRRRRRHRHHHRHRHRRISLLDSARGMPRKHDASPTAVTSGTFIRRRRPETAPEVVEGSAAEIPEGEDRVDADDGSGDAEEQRRHTRSAP